MIIILSELTDCEGALRAYRASLRARNRSGVGLHAVLSESREVLGWHSLFRRSVTGVTGAARRRAYDHIIGLEFDDV